MSTRQIGTRSNPAPTPPPPAPKNAAFPSGTGSRKSHGMSRRSCPVSQGGSLGERDYFYLNTKGICLLCYEECDPVTNEEKRRVSVNFSRLVSRYLGFSMEDVIANSLKAVGRKANSSFGRGEGDDGTDRRFDKVAFELCDRCVGLAHAFNQVYFQVQFHQMILDRCVRSVSDIIRKANKKSINELFVLSEDDQAMQKQQKSFTRLTLGGIRSAHRLRTKLLKRSLTKLSSSFPVIKLRRINKSGDWNLLFNKQENGFNKNGLVPAALGPAAALPLPKNSKKVLMASFLGCIVSFWIVLSLSFINLDQLVINIKREKMIELKLERDIGVDFDNTVKGTPKKGVVTVTPSPFRSPLPMLPSTGNAATPKQKRKYVRKNVKKETDEDDDEFSPREPVTKRKRNTKPKNKVEIVHLEFEGGGTLPVTPLAPLSVQSSPKKPKPVVIAPPQPKPNSVQAGKLEEESKEGIKDPKLSVASSGPSLSQFPSSQSTPKQTVQATSYVPPAGNMASYSAWPQPNKSIPQPPPAASTSQYPPSHSHYAPPPPTPYLPPTSQPQDANAPPLTAATNHQYGSYMPNSSNHQQQYQPQSNNSYYPQSDPHGVPSSSASTYQPNNPYYAPPAPTPHIQHTSDVATPQNPNLLQRRPSYNGIIGYDLDADLNAPGNSGAGNNYNYSYNSTTYNYSNNNASSSSWSSNYLTLGETHHPQPNQSSSSNSSTLPPVQTSGYSFSSVSGDGTPQPYSDYNYGSTQLTPLNDASAPNDGSNSGTTNIGIYTYDGHGNYVLQQETSYPSSSYPSEPSTSTSSSSVPPYYTSMLPPISNSASSAISYLSSMEPKVDPSYNGNPMMVEEPAPSLTYEEPPPQLHDLEVEEQQSELEEAATEGDPESKSVSKSLSVFPEVHWKQQSKTPDSKICCSHPTCTEQFITNSQLQLHLRTHGTFTCSFCQLSFGKAHNLALHEKLKHAKSGTGNKGKCPRCEFHMTPSTYKFLLHFLNTHLKISVHDEPCDVCNKPFVFGTKSINRRNHFRKYHDIHGKDPETYRKCSGCSAPFLKESQLKEHHEKMHCTATVDYTARASSVASTISVTTAEEITYTTAMATADQIVS